mmetsp:Transcript_36823/g.85084  ORF Transcript_36823/g.85084 Transcript_36823/m.85084 type:complete len:279 (-) Transcript_36823:757-1593(-)
MWRTSQAASVRRTTISSEYRRLTRCCPTTRSDASMIRLWILMMEFQTRLMNPWVSSRPSGRCSGATLGGAPGSLCPRLVMTQLTWPKFISSTPSGSPSTLGGISRCMTSTTSKMQNFERNVVGWRGRTNEYGKSTLKRSGRGSCVWLKTPSALILAFELRGRHGKGKNAKKRREEHVQSKKKLKRNKKKRRRRDRKPNKKKPRRLRRSGCCENNGKKTNRPQRLSDKGSRRSCKQNAACSRPSLRSFRSFACSWSQTSCKDSVNSWRLKQMAKTLKPS